MPCWSSRPRGIPSLSMACFPENFDPDGPTQHSGIFGLPEDLNAPLIPILPVPWEATCSYGTGTAQGPHAILRASHQVDLEDPYFGPIWKKGIQLLPPSPLLTELAPHAHNSATTLRQCGTPMDSARAPAHRAVIQGLSSLRTDLVRDWVFPRLRTQRPGVLGGDHSCALGAFLALDKQGLPFSVLQIDAHLDLRETYEGFVESHASVMFNLLDRCDHLVSLVQLGIRDFSASERALAQSHPKAFPFFLPTWRRKIQEGHPFLELLENALGALHQRIWISLDIDGLEPSLCPHTGTPVPGGFSFEEVSLLFEFLSEKGFEVLGFDLCEVAPEPLATQPQNAWEEWDALVGARILYKLCGTVTAPHSPNNLRHARTPW